MAQHLNGNLVLAVQGFDYAPLEPCVADQVRDTAARIRVRVQQTLDDIIDVGNDLLQVKDALAHGQFGPWLRAEFGWTERTARNFMAVAEGFGPKRKLISDLTIQPTAAYLLAAPSAPEAARQAALERAEAGEQITTAVAKEILAKTRKKRRPRLSADKLGPRLGSALERYRKRWNPKELSAFCRQLREFADAMETMPSAGKKVKD